MDTNEIMTNEEVIETAEEIVQNGSGKGFKVAVGIGLAVLAGVIVYKYVAKPMMTKIKAQKEPVSQEILEEEITITPLEHDEEEPEESE